MLYYIFTIVFCIIAIIILKIGFNLKLKDVKQIKELGYDKNLNNIANKFPENKEICEKILKKLGNKTVKVEENKESKASLYIAVTNKIIIANIKDTFARIQTIAHECLHSVQNRKILLFNFIFSNIYIIYFVASLILIFFRVGEKYFNTYMYIQIYYILTLIYIGIRTYLENEAMSKAMYVAKEYMEEYKVTKDQCEANKNMKADGKSKIEIKNEDIQKLVKGFEEINRVGIPFTNFYLITLCLLKIILLCVVGLI